MRLFFLFFFLCVSFSVKSNQLYFQNNEFPSVIIDQLKIIEINTILNNKIEEYSIDPSVKKIIIKNLISKENLDYLIKIYPNVVFLKVSELDNSIEKLNNLIMLLSSFDNVKYLDLSDNILFGGRGLVAITPFLKKIQYLNLSNSSKYDSIEPLMIKKLAKGTPILEFLDISNNVLGDDCGRIIYKFKNIEYLSVSNTNITEKSLRRWVRFLKNLKYLDLSKNHITRFDLEKLDLTKIIELDLSDTPIKDSLKRLGDEDSSLLSLKAHSSDLTDDDLSLLYKKFPRLKVLDLSNNFITPNGYNVIFSFLESGTSNIEELKISPSFNDHDKSMTEKLKSFKRNGRLKKLEFYKKEFLNEDYELVK
ncbi:MAG: hypothetical protein Q8L85_10525 [Alphaproteobacteria bacterium]|nr:hypothetical protein [Alphaproteobacteria bacterium]